MRSHFTPVSVGKKTMRSHFISGAAIACAVTGATALMPTIGAAQAYDSAFAMELDSRFNRRVRLGTWSFDGTTDPGGVSDPGAQQELSSAGAIGTA